MTDLDDAFNTATPLLGAPAVTVDWQELPTGMSVGGVDSLRDFGQQLGDEGYKLSHSMDDGLPDSVTMTGNNDASGSMEADLVGREANIADILTGWRVNTTNGFGSGIPITVTLPSGLAGQDYVVVAITANNQSGVYEATYEVGDPHGWELLATVTDTSFTTYVFGRTHWMASLAPDFRIRTSGSWSWVAGAVGAHYTAGTNSIVPVKPGTVTTAVEGVVQTNHTSPLAVLPSRGYMLGIFAAGGSSGPWTPVSGGTELVESTGGTAALQMVKADLITLDGSYQFVSATNASTDVAMMVTIPLVIMDRPAMDAMAFFSPFDSRSPVRTFERDTARVGVDMNIISPAGEVATPIFEGQMADITLSGRRAGMKAVSKTRILLDKALTLPTVYGNRESCTTDWLATYVLGHGGQYPGVAPSPQTRYWATMHGSVHANMAGPNSYNAAHYWTIDDPGGFYGQKPPGVVEGPFVTAMYGQSLNERVEQVRFFSDNHNWSREVPGMVAENNDICSMQNSTCRLTFWVRGDATDVLPTALGGGTDRLFDATITQAYSASDSNFISCRIDSDRRPQIYLESGLILTGGNLPVDGLWHFYGFTWNYDTGVARVRRDNVFWDLSGFTSAATPMPVSEQANNNLGRYVTFDGYCRLPIAELQLEAGPTLYNDQFSRFYPTPVAPSLNATFKPTNQWVEAVAETSPSLGWTTLQQLAQSTVSSLRVDEQDNVVMAPLSYYGEAAQMTVEPYNELSTDVNAGELAVVLDPTKTRNYVTVEYQETRTDTNRTSVLDITSSMVISPGETIITFPLELPAAELHGATGPYIGSTWDFTKLGFTHVNGTVPLPNEHLISINSQADGAGTQYVGSTGITVRIIAWSSSTVTIRFVNNLGSPRYMVTSYSDIPFLRVLGYPIRRADAYQSFRDVSSQSTRRERALTTEASWIQTRDVAADVAGKIVTVTSRPRPEIAVIVMGDPRRTPGQLASIADSEGTRAEGTWRIHAIDHEGAGGKYVQTLKMFRIGPVGVWDEGNWDDAVWGE